MSKKQTGLNLLGNVVSERENNNDNHVNNHVNNHEENNNHETSDNHNPVFVNTSNIVKEIESKNKKFDKQQVGIYLDKDVYDELKKFSKKFGRGSKSELINNLLRETLLKK